MDSRARFGFVTGCHVGDRFLVQATLASMRHFCPRVPICLVVDGNFDVSDLESEYGLIILRVSDLPSAEMRRIIGGNYRAKLAAMWEGPFDYFVWLDSDAMVWGDFSSHVRTDLDFHIFWRPNRRHSSPEFINGRLHFHFDPVKLSRFDPQFKWQGNNYFCSGAFGARRNAITFREWVETESWEAQCPGLFFMGEQGALNYLVHAKAQRGELSIASSDLQHVWQLHGTQELKEDCAGTGWGLPSVIPRPRVVHFCYRKPLIHDLRAFCRPFTLARLSHQRKRHSPAGAWLALLGEEALVLAGSARWRLNRLLRGER